MKQSNSYYFYISLFFFLVVGFLPGFGAIDTIGFEWLFLSFISLIFLLLNSSFIINIKLNNKLILGVFLSFFSLFFFSLLSFYNSINISESIIEFSRIVTVFTVLISFCSILFSHEKALSFNSIFIFISLLLFGELIFFYYYLLSDLYYNSPDIRLYGFAGNKNVAAASILIKLPFLLFLNSPSWVKRFKLFLLYLSICAIIIIGSRTSFISLTFIFLSFIYFRKHIINFKFELKSHLITIALALISIIICNDRLKSVLRLTTDRISITDANTTTRLEYYLHALNSIYENFFFGVGLGNWKIVSILFNSENIKGYVVPYHVHNDFLQFFAETGVFGGLSFTAIFVFSFLLAINLIRKANPNNKAFYFPLIISISVFLIDSLFNFPFSRPSVLVFFIFIISLLIFNSRYIQDLSSAYSYTKSYLTITIFFLLGSILVSFKVFTSFRLQKKLISDFNNNITYVDSTFVSKLNSNFPNITVTTLPISTLKANYLSSTYRDSIMDLLKSGDRANPFLHYSDILRAAIYTNENNLDSALYFSKRAFYSIPNNELHSTTYLNVLSKLKDTVEMTKVFNRVKSNNSESLWIKYLKEMVLVHKDSSKKINKTISKAFNLFPNNKLLPQIDINAKYGDYKVSKALLRSQRAEELYNKSLYLEAANIYLELFDLIPDFAYLENAGNSFYQANMNNRALFYFDKVIESKKIKSGKSEFLKGLLLIETGSKLSGCKFIQKSIKLNYPDAIKYGPNLCN